MTLATIALLALLVPLQGMARVAPGLRGPAHYHVITAVETTAHKHVHADTEHHHHAADEGAILADDDDEQHHLDAIEETRVKPGTGVMVVDVLPTGATVPHLLAAAQGLVGADERKSPSAFIGRLERPPDSGPRASMS